MAPPVLTLKDIHLSFGGTPLLEGAELTVAPGDRICLVGRNGSGKSTLLKIAAGHIEPDRGERFVHPSAHVRYLAQEADFGDAATVADYVAGGLAPTDDPHIALPLLQDLGLTGDETVAALSGGEARRAAIARALVSSPEVLLLDEPTNHLDLPAIEWLEDRLKAIRAAIVLISHDRRFLETLSEATVWLDRGQARRLDRGFAAFEDWRDDVLEQEDLERHKIDRKIVREDKWMHGGVTGRRKRNVRRVRELAALRDGVRERRNVTGNVKFEASEAGTTGKLVVETKDVAKAYGERTIVENLNLRVMRQDRLALVGPNGAGKTTILKLLTGDLTPDRGTVRHGTNIESVVLDQKRDELDPAWTLADAMTGGKGDQVIVNGKPRHVASYMKDFLFLPEQRLTPVGVLSGGERARLLLARALAKPSNVLVLDEPTNDLDLETLDLLQELLADYAGTVLLVSHDRDFIDRVATSVLTPDGGARWLEYPGGYSDMLAQRRGGPDSGKPKSAASPRAAAAGDTARDAGTAPVKRKLSYKEKHALETLPATIAKLEKDITALNGKLADADLFTRDRAAFEAATASLAKTQSALDDAETQWLELEDLKAALEG